MSKKTKETNMNLYYLNNGQAINEAEKRKMAKEREKRIKQNKQKDSKKDQFDLETETVIQMTNRNKIKKDQEKKKQLTKKEQKRRRRIKKIFFILKLIISIGIIAGGIVFALTSPIFNIKDIQVSNNNQVPQETIISLSSLKYDENIFRFYGSNVIENIKQNAYIQNVIIHRKLPNTVQIEVEERVHKYSVDFMGQYAYINNQGYVLEISEDSKGLPIIQGITTSEEQVVPGARLNVEDLEKLENVIKIIDISAENGLDSKVTSIDITDKNEYSIYLSEERKTVHLGDCSNLSNKMLYVVAILEQTKDQEGQIFVNGDLNNGFQAYLKPKI